MRSTKQTRRTLEYQIFELADASLASGQVSREAVHHHTKTLVLVETEVELRARRFCRSLENRMQAVLSGIHVL